MFQGSFASNWYCTMNHLFVKKLSRSWKRALSRIQFLSLSTKYSTFSFVSVSSVAARIRRYSSREHERGFTKKNFNFGRYEFPRFTEWHFHIFQTLFGQLLTDKWMSQVSSDPYSGISTVLKATSWTYPVCALRSYRIALQNLATDPSRWFKSEGPLNGYKRPLCYFPLDAMIVWMLPRLTVSVRTFFACSASYWISWLGSDIHRRG